MVKLDDFSVSRCIVSLNPAVQIGTGDPKTEGILVTNTGRCTGGLNLPLLVPFKVSWYPKIDHVFEKYTSVIFR